ncbi:MAG: PD-(D/E)XK nuclease family protein [Candidatus Cloacimonetes bacterium]|nr:PD-(D/E)XK nuclease family protein [Candidatus Cloacimonadota bacterium]
MEFITVGFSQSLNEAVFSAITERTVLIFPTRASANAARLEYQARWTLQELTWISMEDFRSLLICMDAPVPEDDKRLICLWQVLSDEDKEHFHLGDFSDLISWGSQFFGFCADLCDANIGVLSFEKHIEQANLNLRIWQEENIARLSAILTRYHDFITNAGFSDRIFHQGAAFAQMPFTGHRIISVNQYYYSQLEKDLLTSCEAAGNEVLLFYHGVQPDKASWQPGSLDLAQSWNELAVRPDITLYQCDNEQQAILSFLALDVPDCAIIDANFHNKDYSALFPKEKIRLPHLLPISETLWYRQQGVLLEILENLQDSPGFIPLRLILKYFNSLPMVQPYCPQWQECELQAFLKELYALNAVGILYLDLEPERQFDSGLILPFTLALSAVLGQIGGIRSTKDLSILLQEELSPQRFSTEQELGYTDLIGQVWSAMANYAATEEMSFFTTWDDIYPTVYLGIFENWLDFLKSIRLKRIPIAEPDAIWELSNLLDSRNRSFERVAFFNLVEGVLPQAPGPIWLLNEHQRKVLGLKTYDDIRSWERYYFFRMLFCAREVLLFSYLDAAKAIDHSSFIGELTGFLKHLPEYTHVNEQAVLEAWRDQSPSYPMPEIQPEYYHAPADASFFTLPCEPVKDFYEGRQIRCNSYDLQLFTYNPFVWYVRSLKKIEPRLIRRREEISPVLFGTLMHAFFSHVLGNQATHHLDLGALDAVFSANAALKGELLKIIDSPAFLYKMPQNYNSDYLRSIICDRLADSLREFYQRFLKRRWQGIPFTMIPEEEYMRSDEKRYKLLTQCGEGADNYQVLIHGKADLRIESDRLRCIVDFKTGSANVEQLIFYEWIYYLLENPGLEDQVQSWFWLILDMKASDTTSRMPQKRAKYLGDVHSALEACLMGAYTLAATGTGRQQMREISRSDLYLPGAKQ